MDEMGVASARPMINVVLSISAAICAQTVSCLARASWNGEPVISPVRSAYSTALKKEPPLGSQSREADVDEIAALAPSSPAQQLIVGDLERLRSVFVIP